MEALIGSLIALFLGQGGLMWYKLGKLEKGLSDLTREVRNNNQSKKGEK